MALYGVGLKQLEARGGEGGKAWTACGLRMPLVLTDALEFGGVRLTLTFVVQWLPPWPALQAQRHAAHAVEPRPGANVC